MCRPEKISTLPTFRVAAIQFRSWEYRDVRLEVLARLRRTSFYEFEIAKSLKVVFGQKGAFCRMRVQDIAMIWAVKRSINTSHPKLLLLEKFASGFGLPLRFIAIIERGTAALLLLTHTCCAVTAL